MGGWVGGFLPLSNYPPLTYNIHPPTHPPTHLFFRKEVEEEGGCAGVCIDEVGGAVEREERGGGGGGGGRGREEEAVWVGWVGGWVGGGREGGWNELL